MRDAMKRILNILDSKNHTDKERLQEIRAIILQAFNEEDDEAEDYGANWEYVQY